MGRAKDLMMQEEEQGWSFSDNQVCSRCISDAYLKAVIRTSATDESPCTFCGRRPSVGLDDVMEIIGNTVADYFNRAVNEAPYETAEGGYQGLTYDTYDVLDEIVGDISRRDSVIDAIRASFDEDIWVERNMFSLNGVHRYVASWERFCDAVKRESRHPGEADPHEDERDAIPVAPTLDALSNLVEESGLIRGLPANRVIHRARAHRRTEQCNSRETLGPPPSSKAPTNRMSAAGVSVFYGALEAATAAAEASVSMPPGHEWILTCASWHCARPLQVLDLSRLPRVPSIFAISREQRGGLLFLREFVKSITAPVVHDGREHIEYVPTQVLTEYFRQQVKALDGSALDGIVYPSARRRGGRSLVVFRSQEDLEPDTLSGREPLLQLDSGSVKLVRRPARKGNQGSVATVGTVASWVRTCLRQQANREAGGSNSQDGAPNPACVIRV